MMDQDEANNPVTLISTVYATYRPWWKLQPSTIVVAAAAITNLGILASTPEAAAFALGAGLIALVAAVHELKV